MSGQESRLTDEDRSRIAARAKERALEGFDLLTCTRVALHAIGCTALDLRDAELAEVEVIVGGEYARATRERALRR